MLLVRGDVRQLELEESMIQFPAEWGAVQDTEGTFFLRCDVLITPYVRGHIQDCPFTQSELKQAGKYFGPNYEPFRCFVDIPKNAWHFVGHVRAIRYARKGRRGGVMRHGPFKVPIPLYRSSSFRAYKLVLPCGCVLDERGFVWP